MARFYKTARPQFVEDIMYQPPWEMMQAALMAKQTGFDNTLAQTEALNGLLKINHVDDEVENQNVASEKELWEDQINEITNTIKQTGDYRGVMPRIRELQKGIMQSREDGNIAKFEQSAAVRDKLLKGIQDAKTQKDGKGDIAGANKRLEHFYNSWRGNANRSLDDVMKYEELIARPEALDYETMRKTLDALDPAMSEYVKKLPDGKGYFISEEGKKKGITPDRIMKTVMGKLGQDPNIGAYYQQRSTYGLSPDVIQDGKLNFGSSDEEGNFNLSDNELGSFIKGFLPKAYMESTGKLEYSPDSTVNQALGRNLRRELQEDKQVHDKEMEGLRQGNRLDLAKFKNDPEKYQEELNRLQGFNSFAEIKNAPIPSLFDMSKDGTFSQADRNKLESLFTDLTKGMTGKELKAYQELKPQIESGEISTPQQANAFLFNKMYPTVEDYLRVATDDYASEGEVLAAKAHYEGHLTKGEDWYAFGIANETNEKVFKNFKSFSERAQGYLNDKYNSATIVKEFESLPDANSKAITSIVNENMNDYTFTDVETGNAVTEVPKMKANKGISGASGRATNHTMFEGEDGRKYVAIPKAENSPSQLAIKNIAIKGLTDNSMVKNELINSNRGAMLQQFNENKESNNFNQEITLDDSYFGTGFKVTQKGNGVDADYVVVNPKFGSAQTFDNEDSMFNYLELKAQEQANEKAKK